MQTVNLTDILAQAGGLQSVARDLGISEAQAASGAEALLHAILGGMKKQAQAQPAGLEGLGGLLGQLGAGGLFDQGPTNRTAALPRLVASDAQPRHHLWPWRETDYWAARGWPATVMDPEIEGPSAR